MMVAVLLIVAPCLLGQRGVTASPAQKRYPIPEPTLSPREPQASLIDYFDASNWLVQFEVESIADPTHGHINYVKYDQALQSKLLDIRGNQVYMGVDSQTVLDPAGNIGRNSVRVVSRRSFNQGLFIADIAHMPGGACGLWPAYWLTGPDWPNNGEIDIIEGVHTDTNNQPTLHTSVGCKPQIGPEGESGARVGLEDSGWGNGYQGLGVRSRDANTFGAPFNAGGGGVYATKWTSDGIQVWFFPRTSIPEDIRDGMPEPGGWGRPQANFVGGCDYGAKFGNMRMIFNTNLCGDWAGTVWEKPEWGCAARAPTCKEYVSTHPGAFAEAYWLINSVKVYAV